MDHTHGESLRRRTFEVVFLAGALLLGSLATYNLGVACWVSDDWGVAARHVVGPGSELWDPVYDSSDRTYIGLGSLRYTTVTARRRWFMTGGTQLDVGFGLMLNGSYESIGFLKRPGRAPLRLGADIIFGGWSFEMFAGRKLASGPAWTASTRTTIRRTAAASPPPCAITTARCRWSATSRSTAGGTSQVRPAAGGSKGSAASPRQSSMWHIEYAGS